MEQRADYVRKIWRHPGRWQTYDFAPVVNIEFTGCVCSVVVTRFSKGWVDLGRVRKFLIYVFFKFVVGRKERIRELGLVRSLRNKRTYNVNVNGLVNHTRNAGGSLQMSKSYFITRRNYARNHVTKVVGVVCRERHPSRRSVCIECSWWSILDFNIRSTGYGSDERTIIIHSRWML